MEIQESLNNRIEEHNTIHEDSDDPIILTNDIVQDILAESGVPQEITTKIEKSYSKNFGDTPPIAEVLIDNKALAAKAQKKKEEMLEKQVRILQSKLERTQENMIKSSDEISDNTNEMYSNITEVATDIINEETTNVAEIHDEIDITVKTENEIESNINVNDNLENTDDSVLDADIVVKVNPEKVEKIETKIIDGKKYMVIPIDDNEQANVNGVETLL